MKWVMSEENKQWISKYLNNAHDEHGIHTMTMTMRMTTRNLKQQHREVLMRKYVKNLWCRVESGKNIYNIFHLCNELSTLISIFFPFFSSTRHCRLFESAFLYSKATHHSAAVEHLRIEIENSPWTMKKLSQKSAQKKVLRFRINVWSLIADEWLTQALPLKCPSITFLALLLSSCLSARIAEFLMMKDMMRRKREGEIGNFLIVFKSSPRIMCNLFFVPKLLWKIRKIIICEICEKEEKSPKSRTYLWEKK